MVEFIKESDRAAVVLGAAKIDSLLCSLIDSVLVPCPGGEDDLLEGDAPLSTFSARIRVAHRLGIIDPEFAKLLHILRRLRNGFAHEISHSSLSDGAPRDRVVAMSAGFRGTPYFSSIVDIVANQSKRDGNDPGVVFRAMLAIFLMHMFRIRDSVRRMQPQNPEPMVEYYRKRKAFAPKGSQEGSAAG